MHAHVHLRTPDGTTHELVHGDIVGRLRTAALPLDDGRVSEAHAMVSLREGQLRLIALRGAFAVEGRPLAEVALVPGLVVQLARGVLLTVDHVALPDTILGVEGPDLPRQALPGVCSLVLSPRLHLARGWIEGAAAHLWSTGEGWRIREGTGPTGTLFPGQELALAGQRLRVVAIPLLAAGQTPTRQHGGVGAPLRLVANFDTVHIHREGQPACVLSGLLARIVSELVALGGPVGWQVLAGQLWPGVEAQVTRARLDVNLSRLRRKLREARIRTDLVRTDGAGSIELLLYPHDQVEDRT